MTRVRRLSEQAIAVLETLAGGEEWLHGYELSRRTGLKPGTLYPLLERLAVRALLDSRWEDSPLPGRPRRNLYRLTEAGGRAALAARSARPVSARPVGLGEAPA